MSSIAYDLPQLPGEGSWWLAPPGPETPNLVSANEVFDDDYLDENNSYVTGLFGTPPRQPCSLGDAAREAVRMLDGDPEWARAAAFWDVEDGGIYVFARAEDGLATGLRPYSKGRIPAIEDLSSFFRYQ